MIKAKLDDLELLEMGRRAGISEVVMSKLPDGWFDPADDSYYTSLGQRLVNVHSRNSSCDSGCVIHNPSAHHMREFRTHWRTDIGIMERLCKHGIGHPDPDSTAHLIRSGGYALANVHSCDGCCGSKDNNDEA